MCLDDELELLLLGMRLAKCEVEKIPDTLFGGTIRKLVDLPDDKKRQGLIDWLLARGVKWDGNSPVVDAIVERLSVIRERESSVRCGMEMIDSMASAGVFPSTGKLLEARDRLRKAIRS